MPIFQEPMRPRQRRPRSGSPASKAAAAGGAGGGCRAMEKFSTNLFHQHRRASMEMEGESTVKGDEDLSGIAPMVRNSGNGERPSVLDREWSSEPDLSASDHGDSSFAPSGSFEAQLQRLKLGPSSKGHDGSMRSKTSQSSAESSASNGSSSIQSSWAGREEVRKMQMGPNPFAFF